MMRRRILPLSRLAILSDSEAKMSDALEFFLDLSLHLLERLVIFLKLSDVPE